jgi:hypothetical protein
MTDSLTQVAQVIPYKEIAVGFASVGLGMGAGITVIGKLLYNYLNTKHCPEHASLHADVLETKNDVKWIKSHLRGEI